MVGRADTKPRAAIVGEIDNVLTLEFFDVHLRSNEDRFLGCVPAAGVRIEDTDLVDLLIQLVHVTSRILRQMLETMRLQIFKVIADKFSCEAFALTVGFELGEEAFSNVKSSTSNWLEHHHRPTSFLDRLGAASTNFGQLFDRRCEA